MKSHQIEFGASSKAVGAPSWWMGSSGEAEAYLAARRVHAFEIDSSLARCQNGLAIRNLLIYRCAPYEGVRRCAGVQLARTGELSNSYAGCARASSNLGAGRLGLACRAIWAVFWSQMALPTRFELVY